jgi:hypothetical protein
VYSTPEALARFISAARITVVLRAVSLVLPLIAKRPMQKETVQPVRSAA